MSDWKSRRMLWFYGMLPIVDDCGFRPEKRWNARRHLHLRIRSIDSAAHPETNMNGYVPEGTLANLHTSGITGQGLVSREAMDDIRCKRLRPAPPLLRFFEARSNAFLSPIGQAGRGLSDMPLWQVLGSGRSHPT